MIKALETELDILRTEQERLANWKFCPVCGCLLDDHWQSLEDWYEHAASGEDPSAYHQLRRGEIGEACNDCCDCMRFADGEDYA